MPVSLRFVTDPSAGMSAIEKNDDDANASSRVGSSRGDVDGNAG